MSDTIKTYHPALWKGIRTVFTCDICGTNRDDEDAMMEHVLLHYPLSVQGEILNLMLKEQKDGRKNSTHSPGD